MNEDDYPKIKTRAEAVSKAKQPFERIVLTKAEALRMFADNPFKASLIAAKIPDGGYTTAYRCGPLIDLCRGPHVPTTAAIKAFEVTKTSASYWLGNTDNDGVCGLQRGRASPRGRIHQHRSCRRLLPARHWLRCWCWLPRMRRSLPTAPGG